MSEPIAFERVDPAEGVAKVFRTEERLSFTPGDVVSTPRGVGVVNAALTSSFDFPAEGDETRVSATSESPAYIVGFGGRSAPYRAAALSDGDLYNPQQSSTQSQALAGPVAEHGLHREAMRDGWTRRDLLGWWSNAGGLWEKARTYLKRERNVSDDEARAVVSKRKDMVLGTNRWRTRF